MGVSVLEEGGKHWEPSGKHFTWGIDTGLGAVWRDEKELQMNLRAVSQAVWRAVSRRMRESICSGS